MTTTAIREAEASSPMGAPGVGTPARPRGLRVLHVLNQLDTGGTEFGVLKVIAGLNGDEFEHRICTMRGFNPEWVRRRGLEGQVIAVGEAGRGLRFTLSRLLRVFRACRPHIVHSRNWGAIEAVWAARLAQVPVVIHSEHGYELDMLAGMPLRRRLLRRVACGLADVVFTVTRDLGAYHARNLGLSPERFRVVYNGVDTDRFTPRPEDRLRLRKGLGLPANGFVVGTMGRLDPIKDHRTLLRAVQALLERGVDVRALVVGSGPEREGLQRFVQSCPELGGRVLLLESSDEVPALLNLMDVFVLSSVCEGMSNTILEAMATGLPVVATRAGGNPELVKEDETGWLFPVADAEGLAERLHRLSAYPDLRRRFGAAARRRAVESFSLRQMLESYRGLYREVATARGILRRG